MSGTVEQIKSRLGIAEVVGSYLKLERAGRHLKARCPFHNEKTPSFFVSPERETYHCFGCNRGGDIFSFVEEIEGLDFLGALKILAGRAGVTLRAEARSSSAEERLREVIEAATEFFTANLRSAVGAPARRYLLERGVSAAAVERWRLGFAPADWRALFDHLVGCGLAPTLLVNSGLVVAKTGGGYFDRFRGRIMFPLFDSAGRPVAFSGRYLVPTTGEKAPGAKYLNSPETPIYHKSRLLYGYDRAKVGIRERGFALLVEGQFDLVLAHEAGWTNTVAVSGTALSADHLRLIRRLTDQLTMIYDPDEAGVRAARRSLGLALAEGFTVRLSLLPAGSDPAALIQRAPAAFAQAVETASPMLDFLFEVLRREAGDAPTRARRAREEIYPLLAALPHRADEDFFLQRLAEELNLTPEAVRNDFQTWRARVAPVKNSPTSAVLPVTKSVRDSRLTLIEERLFGIWFWQQALSQPELDLDSAKHDFVTVFEEAHWQRRLAHWRERSEQLALAAELAFAGVADLALEWRDLLRHWQMENKRDDLRQALLALKKAETVQDESAIDNYLKKCQDITRQLSQLENNGQKN